MSPLEQTMWAAIEASRCPGREGPYGLYDYSRYEGKTPPHQIRDFRDPNSPQWGTTVFETDDPEIARIEFERLTAQHVARAAIGIVGGVVDKAKALVALLDDAEVNHGSLVGPKTMRAIGELRLELSRWSK